MPALLQILLILINPRHCLLGRSTNLCRAANLGAVPNGDLRGVYLRGLHMAGNPVVRIG